MYKSLVCLFVALLSILFVQPINAQDTRLLPQFTPELTQRFPPEVIYVIEDDRVFMQVVFDIHNSAPAEFQFVLPIPARIDDILFPDTGGGDAFPTESGFVLPPFTQMTAWGERERYGGFTPVEVVYPPEQCGAWLLNPYPPLGEQPWRPATATIADYRFIRGDTFPAWLEENAYTLDATHAATLPDYADWTFLVVDATWNPPPEEYSAMTNNVFVNLLVEYTAEDLSIPARWLGEGAYITVLSDIPYLPTNTAAHTVPVEEIPIGGKRPALGGASMDFVDVDYQAIYAQRRDDLLLATPKPDLTLEGIDNFAVMRFPLEDSQPDQLLQDYRLNVPLDDPLQYTPVRTRLWGLFPDAPFDPVLAPAPDAQSFTPTVDIATQVDPIHWGGCTTQDIGLTEDIADNVPAGRQQIGTAAIPYNPDWTVSEIYISTNYNPVTVYVFSEETVTQETLIAAANGETFPPMWIAFITEDWRQLSSLGSLFQTLGVAEPVWYDIPNVSRLEPGAPATQTTLIMHFLGSDSYLQAHAVEIEHASDYIERMAYYTSPDLLHTLALDIEDPNAAAIIGYPADWTASTVASDTIQEAATSTQTYIHTVGISAEDADEPRVRIYNAASLARNAGIDIAPDADWLQTLSTVYGVSASLLEQVTRNPLVAYTLDGRRGYIMPLGNNYVLEASAPVNDFAQYDALLALIIDSVRVQE